LWEIKNSGQDGLTAYLLTIARKGKAFLDMLKTRRKKKKQDKHLVVLWIIRIFATDTLDYHQN